MAAPLREKCRTARGRLIVLTIQPNIGAIILSVEHCGHQGPAVSHAESGALLISDDSGRTHPDHRWIRAKCAETDGIQDVGYSLEVTKTMRQIAITECRHIAPKATASAGCPAGLPENDRLRAVSLRVARAVYDQPERAATCAPRQRLTLVHISAQPAPRRRRRGLRAPRQIPCGARARQLRSRDP